MCAKSQQALGKREFANILRKKKKNALAFGV